MQEAAAKTTDETPTARRLLELARPQIRLLLAATVLMLLGSAAGLAAPAVAGGVVDAALASADASRLDRIALGLVGLFAVMGVVSYFEFSLLGTAGARMLFGLRHRVFANLLTLAPDFHDRQRVGELLSRLSSDLTIVQEALTEQIPGGLQALLRFVGTLTILLLLHTRLTLVALLVIPPVALFAIFFGNRLQKVSKLERDAAAEGSAVAEETLSGIRTVQAFGGEGRAGMFYRTQLDRLLELQMRSVRLVAGFSGLMVFGGFTAFAVVLWYGGGLMLREELSAGDLTAFLLYTFSIATSVGQLGALFTSYKELKGSSARIFELMDSRSTVHEDPDAPAWRATEGAIELDDVTFTYPDTESPALEQVSMSVAPGEMVALVGPSGSGKSTLFSLLLRFYDPQSGTLAVDGRELREMRLADLRAAFSLVPQDVFLFSGSVAHNMRLGNPEATDEELERAARAAHAHDFIAELPAGYGTEIGERGIKLSGGQRQRLAIARAFLRDPKVLLLDEATSSLDPDSEAQVQAALDSLMAERTTLVIAHRLATARRARRIHVIDGGRVAAVGTHAELHAESELYRRYWELQSLEPSRGAGPAPSPEAGPARRDP